ncbi:MAG TPA: hypothetical protein VFR31_03965 [Thermoanaerobaculia bacterium]|nr:hypothetical protein [Thermoanaerobaculia bacterium]
MEDLFETGNDASRGVRIKLPLRVSPLRANAQCKEASSPAQPLESLTRPSDPMSSLGDADALAEDGFAGGQGLHLTQRNALGGSGSVERIVHGGQRVGSGFLREGFESPHHTAREGGSPFGRHPSVREMKQFLDHGHLISREEPGCPHHRLQLFRRDAETSRGLAQEARVRG